MLENPTPTPPDAAPAIKRYAPPNQRNRSVERRKSGEKIQGVVRNNNLVGDSGSSAILNEDHRRPGLIPLEGCSRSDASRLLSNRWAAALDRYHDTSIDLSERPVVYSGSSDSAWRNFRLPHQMMSPTNTIRPSSNSQMDFLPDLHRVIQNANADN
ncbi:uncharacterized protein LOC120133158 isoform X2 [Hibiscus syriacus]|uniref:uncharacterized protein LOC120133158 isoform X2 n=1 Tax=Hibiscus syriacus TaxID=106335 RepID=UPI001920A407|nr:uncharacterized protein LOC120133158 isoform X2 [Hibiscus syriacus]